MHAPEVGSGGVRRSAFGRSATYHRATDPGWVGFIVNRFERRLTAVLRVLKTEHLSVLSPFMRFRTVQALAAHARRPASLRRPARHFPSAASPAPLTLDQRLRASIAL